MANGLTGLLGSLYFVHKWFKCINWLIGRALFKASALTAVWAVVLGLMVLAIWWRSYWLICFAWIGQIFLFVYLLLQLRRSKTLTPTAQRRFKICARTLYGLWVLGILYIWRGGYIRLWFGLLGFKCEPRLFAAAALSLVVLSEMSVVQKMFNLVVCDVVDNREPLDAKIADDWRRLGIVIVWSVVTVSTMLFFWDVGVTVWRVFGLDSGYYHGFKMDGNFHFWLFCEGYAPHAGWQLFLWSVAAAAAVGHFSFKNRHFNSVARVFCKENLKRGFSTLFPSVGDKR